MTDTASYLLNRFGPYLNREEVAGLYRMEPDSYTNGVGRGSFAAIPKVGNLYHYADVAAIIDSSASFLPAVSKPSPRAKRQSTTPTRNTGR